MEKMTAEEFYEKYAEFQEYRTGKSVWVKIDAITYFRLSHYDERDRLYSGPNKDRPSTVLFFDGHSLHVKGAPDVVIDIMTNNTLF